MDYKSFSKKELVDILEVINSTAFCNSQEGIRAILERLQGLVSADYSICGIGKGNLSGLYGPPLIINGNYPMEWLQVYGGDELYFIDPLILHNFTNPGPQLWEDTYSIYREKLSNTYLASQDFGLKYGVSGGLYTETTQTNSLFSFSAPGKNFGEHHKSILAAVTPHIHQALVRVFRVSSTHQSEPLSEREKEIMYWVKEGKTNWEISTILDISERTVKFHVQNIERKLNAVNKAHAVAIQMEQEAVDQLSN